jgi:signal transduction histidine kinase
VTVQYATDRVCVDVIDDGHGRSTPGATGAGRGLVGMRERARLYGGSLSAGGGPDGGFHVHAELPVPREGL